MDFDLKKVLPLIYKVSAVLLGSAIIISIIVLTGLNKILLEDKNPKTSIDEGKYILNRLTEDYEEFLKQKRAELEKETERLLKERGITQSIAERQEIQKRLAAIDSEKRFLSEEYNKNQLKKAEIENALMVMRQELESSGKQASQMNEKIMIIQNEKNRSDNYWKNYINNIITFFSEKYEDDPNKKNELTANFSKDNGKQYILDTFSELYAATKTQSETLSQNTGRLNVLKEEKGKLDTKIKDYEKIMKNQNQYVEIIKKFQNILTNFNSANNYYKQKNFQKSAEQYKKVMQEYDELKISYENLAISEKIIQNDIAKRYLDIGVAQTRAKNYSNAIENFVSIIRDTPKSDYTKDAIANIFKITNQLTDQDKINSENYMAKNLMDKAAAYSKANNYQDAIYTYQLIIVSHPRSDYLREAFEKSNQLKELVDNDKLKEITGFIKEKFTLNYKKYEEYLNKGETDNARNYYFETLKKTFGDYTGTSIERFKAFEDKYIEVLLQNYSAQVLALKLTESKTNAMKNDFQN